MFNFNAVVLAAGRGNRLRPMTATIPKVMGVVDSRPLLEWQIDLLRGEGMTPIVAAWWKSHSIRILGETMGFGVCVEDELKPPPQLLMELDEAGMLEEIVLVMDGDTILPDRPIKLVERLRRLPATFGACVMARPWMQSDQDRPVLYPKRGDWLRANDASNPPPGAHSWSGAMAVRMSHLQWASAWSENNGAYAHVLDALPKGSKLDVLRVMDREHDINTWNEYRLSPRYIKRYYQLLLQEE